MAWTKAHERKPPKRKAHERERIPKTLDTLGDRIRYCRLVRRYHLSMFTKVTGLKDVAQWESGKAGVEHMELRLLAYYLDVPILWLVTGGGEPPVRPWTAAERLMSCVDILPETRLKQRHRKRPPPVQLPDL